MKKDKKGEGGEDVMQEVVRKENKDTVKKTGEIEISVSERKRK